MAVLGHQRVTSSSAAAGLSSLPSVALVDLIVQVMQMVVYRCAQTVAALLGVALGVLP